jgi:hypothetical protein
MARLAGCTKRLPNDGMDAKRMRFDNLNNYRYCEIFLIGGNPIPRTCRQIFTTRPILTTRRIRATPARTTCGSRSTATSKKRKTTCWPSSRTARGSGCTTGSSYRSGRSKTSTACRPGGLATFNSRRVSVRKARPITTRQR